MEYITSIEKIGIEKGHKQGLIEGLKEGVKEGFKEGRREGMRGLLGRQMSKRFRIEREALAPVFEGLTAYQLERLGVYFLEAQSLEEVRELADRMRNVCYGTTP